MSKIPKIKLFAVVLGLLAILAVNAHATDWTTAIEENTIDLNNPDTDVIPLKYASELEPGTDILITNYNFAKADIGIGLDDNESCFLRFGLTSEAEFSTTPIAYTCDGAAGTMAGVEDEYVVFNFTSLPEPGDGTTPGQEGMVDLGTLKIELSDTSASIAMKYGFYESMWNAQQDLQALKTTTATLIQFSPALIVDKHDVTTKRIDITVGSVDFEEADVPKTSPIGKVEVNVNTDEVIYGEDGQPITMLETLLDEGSTITVSGNFTACKNLNGTYTDAALNRVFIDYNGGCDTKDVVATSLSASEALLTLGNTDVLTENAMICMEANGSEVISPGTYSAVFEPMPADGMRISDVNLGVIGELVENGSSAEKHFVMNPDGSFSNYVRIVNPSTESGTVYLTLINDQGTACQHFEMGNVSGISSSILEAGASTGLINVSEIYNTATSRDSSFDIGTGKLRLRAKATFGTTGPGVVVVSFGILKDGTGIFLLE